MHLDYGIDDSFSPVMNKNDDILQGIGNTMVELFNSNRFKYTHTKMKDNNSDHKLLILNITQHGKKQRYQAHPLGCKGLVPNDQS